MPDDIGCGCAGIGMEKCVKNVGDGEAVAAGAERKNGCSGYNRSDAEEFERGTAPILSSKIGGIGRRLRVNNGFVHGLHPRLSDQLELLTEPVRPTEARACGA